jgi:putative glutamine amidotransferase
MANTRRPIIGITGGNAKSPTGADIFQLGRAYLEAVHRAGGTPLMIPNNLDAIELNPILKHLDGILFSGGGDIETARFKGRPHIKVSGVSPERDQLEFVLLKKALNRHLPLLAICRGIQVLNVAFGGDLYTHIADQMAAPLKHDWYPNYPRDKHAHNVSLTKGSLLRDIFQEMEVPVNSLHHQGISKLGEGLTGVAFAPDGLVEGVEIKGERFAIGVQWHPECLPDDKPMQALFASFIAACQS